MIKRSSGILMHISSLPTEYGIGSFGEEAIRFSDLLNKMGIKFWQVLPFGVTDKYNSPYKSYSAFGGNPLFIDLPTLYKKNLITEEELNSCKVSYPYKADYNSLKINRDKILTKAYSRIDNEYKSQMMDFYEKNSSWLDDFSLYMTISKIYNNDKWYEWEEDIKNYKKEALHIIKEKYKEEIMYEIFLQFEFYFQWLEIKKLINNNGVKIFGDMPLYVSLESSDIWANKSLFDLDRDNKPKFISGVPPDYYSKDGQLWGNPLYNWSNMKKDNYSWWIDRFTSSFKLFDLLRIDHFRGFSAYWAIPLDSLDARQGSWKRGPGFKFFQEISKSVDLTNIIAEDLGVVDDKLESLLSKTKFPRMKVIEFGFINKEKSDHLPHNYNKNIVAYSGTHDNDTLVGWIWDASEVDRDFALNYCSTPHKKWQEGGSHSYWTKSVIKTLWASSANLVIIPIQDILGYGNDTRMNIPGQAEGNWEYRVTWEQLEEIDINFYTYLNSLYDR